MIRNAASWFFLLALAHQTGASEPPALPKVSQANRGWKATGELAPLLDRMRKARVASQKVFESLSADQMNWHPSDGTHTPRWNVEHMMGRQLLFFSQIYAEVDPKHHRVIDLNPAQMPPEYRAAHPTWSGADEAAWNQKVGEYVQGHAYLLEGLDLNARAPGSRWRLVDLLRQMERHYNEHTANVRKKMELEDWPSK